MKKVNLKFSEAVMAILQNCIGNRLISYMYDKPDIVNRVNHIFIETEHLSFELKNELEVVDVDGPEDFAVFRLSEITQTENEFVTKRLVQTKVESRISDIIIIRDLIICRESDNGIYRVEMDVGLLFDIGEIKVVFEKDVWFSESMILHHSIKNESELLPVGDGWMFEQPLTGEFKRTFLSIKERH